MSSFTPTLSNGRAHDEATLRFYSEEAPVYVASGEGGASRHLSGFLELLEPSSRILELGCGGGRDTQAMIDRGFSVDPTDGVPQIARKAEERVGRRVRVMLFDELSASEAYDAVWAHASLLHVPRVALPGVLSRIFEALKPGGFQFANYKAGGCAGRDRFGRYFNYLDLTELFDVYRQSAAWQVIASEEYIGGGYEGGQGPWAAIIVRKPLQ